MVFLASLMLTIYDCVQNAVREVGCRRLTISLRSISERSSEYLVRGSFEGMPTNRSNAGCMLLIDGLLRLDKAVTASIPARWTDVASIFLASN